MLPDVESSLCVYATGCRKQYMCLCYRMKKVVYVFKLSDVESNNYDSGYRMWKVVYVQATGSRKVFLCLGYRKQKVISVFRIPDVESCLSEGNITLLTGNRELSYEGDIITGQENIPRAREGSPSCLEPPGFAVQPPASTIQYKQYT